MRLGRKLDHHLRVLLGVLAKPTDAQVLGLDAWDGAIRYARGSGLLAVLDARLLQAGVIDQIPDAVRAHLESGRAVARHRRQMLSWELDSLTRALADFDGQVVLLKGGAYLAQDFPLTEGRLVADIDLMVTRARIVEVEQILLAAGWQHEIESDYDQRYYREWSHELPPMRIPGHVLEIDVHHTITPVTGRLRPNAELLFRDAVPVAGTRFLALAPADQVLHVAVHLFHDSDLDARLRELVDFDSLVRTHCGETSFWDRLAARASELGLQRPLWYALRYAKAWLRSPIPDDLSLAVAKPRSVTIAAMDALVPLALLPHSPDAEAPLVVRTARGIAFLRYHWLRMPPRLLIPHLVRKSLRGLGERFSRPKD